MIVIFNHKHFLSFLLRLGKLFLTQKFLNQGWLRLYFLWCYFFIFLSYSFKSGKVFLVFYINFLLWNSHQLIFEISLSDHDLFFIIVPIGVLLINQRFISKEVWEEVFFNIFFVFFVVDTVKFLISPIEILEGKQGFFKFHLLKEPIEEFLSRSFLKEFFKLVFSLQGNSKMGNVIHSDEAELVKPNQNNVKMIKLRFCLLEFT